jgi:hypothetical protein
VKDHYAVLGIARDAPAEVVRAAFRVLVQKYHPDRNTDSDAGRRAEEINIAYSVLKDPRQRALYDQQLPPVHDASPGPVHRDAGAHGPSPDSFQASPAPMRRTAGRTTYELLFRDGIVREHLEWTETVQKTRHDHRLFVGRGEYVGIESLPRQRLWLRLGDMDQLIERTGELLPVAIGQSVTLVTIYQPGVAKPAVPLALINRASRRWFLLESLTTVTTALLSTGESLVQAGRFLAAFSAALILLYFTLLRHAGILGWAVGLVLMVPVLFIAIGSASQIETSRLKEDIRNGLAMAGMS